MPAMSDLREIKKTLEIHPLNTAEDVKLLFFLEWAQDWIEEYLNRKGKLWYKQRTEYYNGTGTQKLLLRSRPVFATPTIQVYVDENGFFGSPTGSFDPQLSNLVYGQDFCLKIDQDDGISSRSGILLRINSGSSQGQTGSNVGGFGIWPRRQVRQIGFLSPFIQDSFGSIKVVYWGGYTVDTAPGQLRGACNLLVTRMRYIWPVGMAIGTDSYEERAIGFVEEKKEYLMGFVKPMLSTMRNWRW